MALPWAVVFVGLDDTAMAMSRGSVMDCRDKAMGLATAWEGQCHIVGLQDTAMAMPYGTVMDCRNKAMAAAW